MPLPAHVGGASRLRGPLSNDGGRTGSRETGSWLLALETESPVADIDSVTNARDSAASRSETPYSAVARTLSLSRRAPRKVLPSRAMHPASACCCVARLGAPVGARSRGPSPVTVPESPTAAESARSWVHQALSLLLHAQRASHAGFLVARQRALELIRSALGVNSTGKRVISPALAGIGAPRAGAATTARRA